MLSTKLLLSDIMVFYLSGSLLLETALSFEEKKYKQDGIKCGKYIEKGQGNGHHSLSLCLLFSNSETFPLNVL